MTKTAFVYKVIDRETKGFSHIIATSAAEAKRDFLHAIARGSRLQAKKVRKAPAHKQPIPGEEVGGYAALD